MVNKKFNTKEEIEEEFYRIADMWVRGNSLDCLTDLVSFKDKKKAVKDWHAEDDLDPEDYEFKEN